MHTKHIIVILAGGIGSRLMPIYDEKMPKQFHDIFCTGRTLLQATYRRLLRSSRCDEIYIATTTDFQDIIIGQLQSIAAEEMNFSVEDATQHIVQHLIIDPARRDTAAATVYAAQRLYENYSQDILTFVPADQFVMREDSPEYLQMFNALYATVQRDYDVIALASVLPQQSFNGALGHVLSTTMDHYPVFRVGGFLEKPTKDALDAMMYHGASGEVRCNLGIMTCCPGALLDLAQRYLPAIHGVVTEEPVSMEAYQKLRSASIGNALLSQEAVWPSLRVVHSNIGPWADLGTAEQIHAFAIAHLRAPGMENISFGPAPISFVRCKKCVVISDGTCTITLRDMWGILQIVHNGTVHTVRIPLN